MIEYLKKEPDYNLRNLNFEAIQQYGKHQRIDKAIEELVELAHVLTKLKKIPATMLNTRSEMFNEYYKDLLEEMADVLIMVECLFYTFEMHKSEVDVQFFEKCQKLKGILNRDKEVLR